MTKLQKMMELARKNWDRYNESIHRGHDRYQKQAELCENFYLGGGRQWDEDTKKALESDGKPWLEENIIFSTINTVIGYQTQSRMDIAYKPREIDDQGISDILSKLSMFIVDQNRFPWLESQVFSDGLIQQRGFYDVRMDFNENIYGDIKITTLDPLDVIPDPDAKSYDPNDWADVMVTSWMSFDDIKETYGLSVWRKLQQFIQDEPDFGTSDHTTERNKFGTINNYSAYYVDTTGIQHAKLVSRQYWKLQNRSFFLDLESGDLTPVPDNMKPQEAKQLARDTGAEVIKRVSKRVRWVVSTKDIALHDEWSPYDTFTIIPFFPYFRRGVTIGLVDNLIKTQEMLNKVYSQILHTVNTTANSGWIVEEAVLTNMDVEDLESTGSQTGLVLEHKAGRPAPTKIEPNTVPTGLKDLVTSGVDLIRLISGVSETFQGGKGPEVSGTAIQSRVQQAAIQLAAPIDNLFRTRNMVAEKMLNLIQSFYTEERTLVITGSNDEGQEKQEEVVINKEGPEGLINDVSVGKYDVVIADVPTQITFQNAQFSQAIEMRKFGVEIPDDEMVKMSTLSRKNEIAKKIEQAPSPEQQKLAAEEQRLNIESIRVQNEKAESEAKESDSKTMKQAAEVATMLTENPGLGPILDTLMGTIETEEETPAEPVAQNVQEVPQAQTDFQPRLGEV